jgi:hypothetical protein
MVDLDEFSQMLNASKLVLDCQLGNCMDITYPWWIMGMGTGGYG